MRTHDWLRILFEHTGRVVSGVYVRQRLRDSSKPCRWPYSETLIPIALSQRLCGRLSVLLGWLRRQKDLSFFHMFFHMQWQVAERSQNFERFLPKRTTWSFTKQLYMRPG